MADNKKKPKKVNTGTKKAPRKWSAHDTEARRIRHKKKTSFLESQGIDLTGLRYKDIEKVKMSEIKTGQMSTQTQNYFTNLIYNFDKVVDLSPHSLYVAYMDYAEEVSLESILADIGNMSTKDIISRINTICKTPRSYIRGRSQSSGKAGTAIFSCAPNNYLFDDFIRVAQTNRHINHLHKVGSKKVKQHKGIYKGYQRITVHGSTTIKKITPRKVLEILLGLMDNVNEQERANIHHNFKLFAKDHMPELLNYINNTCL